MEDLQELAVRAKEASLELASLKTGEKNKALRAIAEQIWQDREFILAANGQDVEKASQDGATPAFIDRLTLGEQRLRDLSNSVLQVAELPDPVGRETGWTRPNGLCIRRVQVPLGVIAVIYEARPNVTVDSAVLCFKAGNACILRGSSHALNSNQALVKSMRRSRRDRHGIHEAQQVYRSALPQGRCGAHSERGGECHGPRYRDGSGQLSLVCP